MSRFITTIMLYMTAVFFLAGQEPAYGPGYQTVMMTNPAFAGSEGDGTLRLSYLNFYPGNNFNLHTFFASYDSFIPALHGGASVFVSNDYLGGIINDLRGGVSYAYHLRAGKDIFINAGLTASFYHRGMNGNAMILPDQVDPLRGAILQSSETPDLRGHTVFDIGAGFLLVAGNYMAGISVSHLARPDLEGIGNEEGKLDRKLSLHLSGSFDPGPRKRLNLEPVIFAEMQGSFFLVSGGIVINTGPIALNSIILTNSEKDIDLQTGLSFNKGPLTIFYNYCFNIYSVNKLLPASLIHHAGVAFRLNNVDKRKIIKTINFPKL